MTINFMKKIYEDNIDDHTHMKFTRYGVGEFEKEPVTIKVTGNKVKVQTGPEYIEVLLRILGEKASEDVSIKGKIISTKDVEKRIEDSGIEVKKKWGKKFDIEATLAPEKFKTFLYDFSDCYLLLKAESGKNKVKMGTSLPKPGKLVEKFATGDFSKDFLDDIKEEFLFDVDDFKKEVNIKHRYVISDIKVDENLIEKDPKRARIEAKRKGKIVRTLVVDGEESSKEMKIEV